MAKIIKILLLSLITIAIVYPASSLFFAYLLTSSANKKINLPVGLPLQIEDVSFVTSDNIKLRGWYLPAGDEQKAIILLHGHRDSRLQLVSRAKLFHQSGYSVLLYDARGCGESDPAKISVGYFETADLIAAIQFVRQKGVKDIAIAGISQGAATILLAAEQLQDIRCIVAESSYSNILNALDNRFRLYFGIPTTIGGALFVPFAEYFLGVSAAEIDLLQHIAALQCPVFIVSGTADRKTLPQETEKLFNAAREPKQLWMVEGARHEDLYKFQPGEYQRRVLGFLKKYMMSPVE